MPKRKSSKQSIENLNPKKRKNVSAFLKVSKESIRERNGNKRGGNKQSENESEKTVDQVESSSTRELGEKDGNGFKGKSLIIEEANPSGLDVILVEKRKDSLTNKLKMEKIEKSFVFEWKKQRETPVGVSVKYFDGSDVKEEFSVCDSFDHLNQHQVLRDIRHRIEFDEPTTIQKYGCPLLFQGEDVIGISETGSGKTLTFLLPMFLHVSKQKRESNHPISMVVAPTRELCRQIYDQAVKYAPPSIGIVNVIGGTKGAIQLKKIRDGKCQLLVGTPGRILEFLSTKVFQLHRCTSVVLDEADKMLELGFQKQIEKILGQVHPNRQISLFSATWDKGVQDLVQRSFPNNGKLLIIGSTQKTAATITQEIHFMRNESKFDKLDEVLKPIDESKVLIFCNRKVTVDEVCYHIRTELKRPCLALHGNKTTQERQWAMEEFSSGECTIMIATDVAARGLDIHDIHMVLNFDMPLNIETYIHRVGRTGRAGKPGIAITFFSPEDISLSSHLKQVLQTSNQTIPPQLEKLILRYNQSDK